LNHLILIIQSKSFFNPNIDAIERWGIEPQLMINKKSAVGNTS